MELPDFEEYYEYSEEYADRDMPKLYRKTMRDAKAGQHVEFVGTLCQIAALKTAVVQRRKACGRPGMCGMHVLRRQVKKQEN